MVTKNNNKKTKLEHVHVKESSLITTTNYEIEIEILQEQIEHLNENIQNCNKYIQSQFDLKHSTFQRMDGLNNIE